MKFGLDQWHWFFLAQPEPLPEHQLGADPVGWVRSRMSTGRRGGQPFDEQAVAEYVRCFRQPAAIHASCEDYRAAAGTDLADDDVAAARGQRVTVPLLVLWGEHGFVGRHYGDVTEVWREYAETVTGRSLPCGHFLAEEVPLETAAALAEFLAD
jgi:haloacetate dehalogenase